MNMQITKDQLDRVTTEWANIAGEPLTIDATDIDRPIYAMGSELACLRLEHKMQAGRASYSSNLKTWYYVNK
jgi:hypothetical protein